MSLIYFKNQASSAIAQSEIWRGDRLPDAPETGIKLYLVDGKLYEYKDGGYFQL